MARIRTVKPALFKHEALFDLERESNLPIRLAFIGLFTCCDREGRFAWRPRALKLDVLPYDDDTDFSRVLDALWSRGFVLKYEANGELFGVIPTFNKHQVINNKEAKSEIPAPDESSYLTSTCTRAARVNDASQSPLFDSQGEEEGKGREEEGKELASPAAPVVALRPRQTRAESEGESPLQAACRETWASYSDAYHRRYGTEPVRNAKVNSQVKQFCQALPHDEAPGVAAFYVGHNDAFYVRKCHDLGLLVTDAAKLRTEWATGRRVTGARARQEERAGSMLDALNEIKRERGEL